MSSKNILTIDAIKSYFDLIPKKLTTIDDLLQVIGISERKYQNSIYYIAFLSDSKNAYKYFFIPKSKQINIFDIIQILKITSLVNIKQGFVITEYNIYKNLQYLLGKPIEIGNTDNPNSQINNYDKNQFLLETNKSIYNQQLSNNIKIKENSLIKNYNQLQNLNTFSRDIEILVRIIDKCDLRQYQNEKGLGQLFNMICTDKDGSEMQISCFNKIAEKFFQQIQEGHVYEIIGGFIKTNNTKYVSNIEYQLILNESTIIKEVKDDGIIPNIKLDLKKLNILNELTLHANIDCIGYIIEIQGKGVVNTKNGEMLMQKIYIIDETEYKVEFTLWKKHAEKFFEIGDIILIKKAIISEFNGRNISASDKTKIIINPQSIKEALTLSKWAINFKGNLKSYENLKVKNDIYEYINEEIDKKNVKKINQLNILFNNSSFQENSEYYVIKGIVLNFQNSEKNIYIGCPIQKCKKKLIENENSKYFCHSCKINVKIPAYYMTINLKVKDCSGDQWLDLFGSTAEKFLNICAEEYKELLISNNKGMLNQIACKIEYKQYYFLIKMKNVLFNNVLRKKFNVLKFEKVNIIEDSYNLINLLK